MTTLWNICHSGRPFLQCICHSVSNDAMPCQAFCGDTSAWTPKAAPFRSRRTLLMSRPSSSLHSILQRDPRSHHPSLRDLQPTITHFDLPDSFREASCPLKRSALTRQPRNCGAVVRDAPRVRASEVRKQNTDRRDAEHLLDLLRENRCTSNCRTSRISRLGTQIRGNRRMAK